MARLARLARLAGSGVGGHRRGDGGGGGVRLGGLWGLGDGLRPGGGGGFGLWGGGDLGVEVGLATEQALRDDGGAALLAADGAVDVLLG